MKQATGKIMASLCLALLLMGLAGALPAQAETPMAAPEEPALPTALDAEATSSFQLATAQLRSLLEKYSHINRSAIQSARGPITRLRSQKQYPTVLADVMVYYDEQRIAVRLLDAQAATVADKAFLSELNALSAQYPAQIQWGEGEISLNQRNEWLDILSITLSDKTYGVTAVYWMDADQKLHITMPGASEEKEMRLREEVLNNPYLVFETQPTAPVASKGIENGISWFGEQVDEASDEIEAEEEATEDALPADEESAGVAMQIKTLVIQIPVYEKEKTVSFEWMDMRNAVRYRYRVTDLSSGAKRQSGSVKRCQASYAAAKSTKETTYRVDIIGYNKTNQEVGAYTAFFRVGNKKNSPHNKPYAPHAVKAYSITFSRKHRTAHVRYRVVTTG